MQEQRGQVVERGTGVAVWRQIEAALLRDIRERHYAAGERIPNETELAERFGCNRHTVRRALGVLEREGLLRVEQGRGTFVQEHAIAYSVGKRTRFSQNLSGQGRSGRIELLRASELPATPELAQALELAPGTPLLQLLTLGHAGAGSGGQDAAAPRAINLARHSFEAARFAGLDVLLRETGSITQALQHFGVQDYTRGQTRVMAAMPDAEAARLLAQPRSRPVLLVDSVNCCSEQGRVFQHTLAQFSGDWVQLVFEP
ncbi:MAG: phosphonate metabolism transcriptional regulator PhnF [Burkholderiales bacterium PBB2]|nr:MAG: phosphonate metabolism transcriptional regulator PhnF [Burkholderiales bacterium PBB2]